MAVPVSLLVFLFGIFYHALRIMLYGADRFVGGGSALAVHFHISPWIIGRTVVAVGTSFPEFAASFVGALRQSTDISMGKVVGKQHLQHSLRSRKHRVHPSHCLVGALLPDRYFHPDRFHGGAPAHCQKPDAHPPCRGCIAPVRLRGIPPPPDPVGSVNGTGNDVECPGTKKTGWRDPSGHPAIPLDSSRPRSFV